MEKTFFVIGVDGGGTATTVALADFSGRMVKKFSGGPSNSTKIGMTQAISNLGVCLMKTVSSVPKNRIALVYIALAGSLERDVAKRKLIKNLLLERFPALYSLRDKIIIEGDQKAAFRSGTDARDGVVLIAGTGSIAMGWRGKKEAIAGGWDYIMGDQGSAFRIGQRALHFVCKQLDGRSPDTGLLRRMIFTEFKIKQDTDLIKKIYGPGLVERVASIASVVDAAAQKKDAIAGKILISAGEEMALAALAVIKKLSFGKTRVPIVLAGGVFRAKIFSDEVKRKIKQKLPAAYFISPGQPSVVGAVKLAAENAVSPRWRMAALRRPLPHLGEKKTRRKRPRC